MAEDLQKQNIRSLLEEHPEGMRLSTVPDLFKKKFGKELAYSGKLLSYFHSIPTFVHILIKNKHPVAYAVLPGVKSTAPNQQDQPKKAEENKKKPVAATAKSSSSETQTDRLRRLVTSASEPLSLSQLPMHYKERFSAELKYEGKLLAYVTSTVPDLVQNTNDGVFLRKSTLPPDQCALYLKQAGCPSERKQGEPCEKRHIIPATWRCDNCDTLGVHRWRDCDLGHCKYFSAGNCNYETRSQEPCPLPHIKKGGQASIVELEGETDEPIPCLAFQAGMCNKGESCEFSHGNDSSVKTVTAASSNPVLSKRARKRKKKKTGTNSSGGLQEQSQLQAQVYARALNFAPRREDKKADTEDDVNSDDENDGQSEPEFKEEDRSLQAESKRKVKRRSSFDLSLYQNAVVQPVATEAAFSTYKLGELRATELKSVLSDAPIFDAAKLAALAKELKHVPDCNLLGSLEPSRQESGDQLYLNTHDPFALVTVGVQGSGKSHTINGIIEGCMLQADPTVRNSLPMCSLVLHYDQNPDTICESSMLTTPVSKDIPAVQEMVVLVSSSNYFKRKKFYEDRKSPNTTVLPLLFEFDQLGAKELKQLMGIQAGDRQLYMTVIMQALRSYNKRKDADTSPLALNTFVDTITSNPSFSESQSGPLQQRLDLLQSLMCVAAENRDIMKDLGSKKKLDIRKLFKPGTLVIVDLTDPLIDQDEANRIFRVVLSMFRTADTGCSKLVVFDEAHKYLNKQVGELASDVVELVRMMRHYAMRIVVSSQNPECLPAELVELASAVIVHRFSSPTWFRSLAARMKLPPQTEDLIASLSTGQALIYCAKSKITQAHPEAVLSPYLYRINIRERLTADGGASITNASV